VVPSAWAFSCRWALAAQPKVFAGQSRGLAELGFVKAGVSKIKSALCLQKLNCSFTRRRFYSASGALLLHRCLVHLLCDLPYDGDSSSYFS